MFFVFIFLSSAVWSAEKRELKPDEDKSYFVESRKAQLQFESPTKMISTTQNLWYLAISRSGIGYDLPSFLQSTTSFTNQGVGLILGRKRSNSFYNRDGFLEYTFEWQKYERQADSVGHLNNTQSLNLLRLNFYQNFLVMNDLKNNIFISIGAGVSPLLATLDQSAISNSSTDFGALFSVKTNFDYPIVQNLIKDITYFALDVEMALSIGKVGTQQMDMSSFKLGTNFNW
jgi:hypothetical protein